MKNSIIKGGVYNVSDQFGNTQNMYVVISDNIYNNMYNTAIVMMVKPVNNSYNNDELFSFKVNQNGISNEFVILTRSIYTLQQSRFAGYKFCVNSQIIDYLNAEVAKHIFGGEVLLKSEARSYVAEEDMRMRIKIEAEMGISTVPAADHCDKDDYDDYIQEDDDLYTDNLSIDDLQKSFAARADNYTSIMKLVSSKRNDNSKKSNKKEETNKKRNYNTKYSKNCMEFLLDYKTLPVEDCMRKWEFESEESLKRAATRAVRLAKQQNEDLSIFKED